MFKYKTKNYTSVQKKYKNPKILKIINIFLNFLIIGSLLSLIMFLSFNNTFSKKELTSHQINACELSKYQVSNIFDYIYDFEELNILSNLGNIKCLSKISWIQIGEDGEKKAYLGSSLKIYRIISYSSNVLLMLLLFLYIKVFKQKILISYFVLNILLITVLVSNESLLRVLFPFSTPNNKQDLFWGLYLFLLVFLIKVKSKYFLWIFIFLSILMETTVVSLAILIIYILKNSKHRV